MAKVLQTRMVGYATDSTRHPLAPMEVVYDVEQPRPSLLQKAVVLVSLVACVAMLLNAIAFVLFDTRLF